MLEVGQIYLTDKQKFLAVTCVEEDDSLITVDVIYDDGKVASFAMMRKNIEKIDEIFTEETKSKLVSKTTLSQALTSIFCDGPRLLEEI